MNLGTAGFRADAVLAARRVFVEKGFVAATLEGIAARVKSSRPALLHHFPSKAHLAGAVRTEAVKELLYFITPQHPDPVAGIDRLAGGYLDFVAAKPEAAAFIFLSDPLELPKDSVAELRVIERMYFDSVVGWFKEPIRKHVFARLPPAAYEPLVLGPSRDYARRWLGHRNQRELKQVRAALVEGAWRALAVR